MKATLISSVCTNLKRAIWAGSDESKVGGASLDRYAWKIPWVRVMEYNEMKASYVNLVTPCSYVFPVEHMVLRTQR